MAGPTNKPYLFPLPKISDPRGNLTFVQNECQIPFAIRRVYWIYDVPGGAIRGSHAFCRTREVILALSGSFDVVLHDGLQEYVFHLNRAYQAVYVPEMLWRTLSNFSTNAIALICVSTPYDEADYIRDFQQFTELATTGEKHSL